MSFAHERNDLSAAGGLSIAMLHCWLACASFLDGLGNPHQVRRCPSRSASVTVSAVDAVRAPPTDSETSCAARGAMPAELRRMSPEKE